MKMILKAAVFRKFCETFRNISRTEFTVKEVIQYLESSLSLINFYEIIDITNSTNLDCQT